jgi:hypothetical protein
VQKVQLWQKVQKMQKVQFWQLWQFVQKVQFLQKWGALALHTRPAAGAVLDSGRSSVRLAVPPARKRRREKNRRAGPPGPTIRGRRSHDKRAAA